MTSQIQTTNTATLRTLAAGLKEDCKALQHANRPEAMRLFRLYRQIATELYRRSRSVPTHLQN